MNMYALMQLNMYLSKYPPNIIAYMSKILEVRFCLWTQKTFWSFTSLKHHPLEYHDLHLCLGLSKCCFTLWSGF